MIDHASSSRTTDRLPSTSSRTTSCAAVADRLPWLLNGSLPESERAEILAHVASCAACREELDETAVAWGVMTRHVPSLALAEYSEGLEPTEISREALESHLAVCPSCRRELDEAMSDRVVDFATRRSTGRGDRRRFRWLAAAAGIVVLVGSGILLRDVDRALAPDRADTPRTASLVAGTATPSPSAAGAASGDLFGDGFETGDTGVWSVVR